MPTESPARPEPSYYVLHGRHSSVLLEARSDEAPLWRYWGPRLPEDCLPIAPLRDGRPMPPSNMDVDQPLCVVPGFGAAWFNQSALLAHRQGQDFVQRFDACELSWQQPGSALRVELNDTLAQIRLTLDYTLDEHDILRVHTYLQNTGAQVLELQWLAAATLPLPGQMQEVRAYHGQWAHEFQLQTEALGHSIWLRENRRGRTSHDNFPGAVVTQAGSTQDAGLVYGAHLAWSGNHRQFIEPLHDGQYQWQLGEFFAPGELRLVPGETLQTPCVFASCSVHGLNGLAANFHAAVRETMHWPNQTMRPRPIHINTWEAMYFDHRPQALRELAAAAADIGVERFVLDDGWFHGRRDDCAALGDWWADAEKYPDGLLPLAHYVQSFGMEFGLWVEPEMVNPDSDLYRAHPEWALQIAGRPQLTMRNQLVLDLQREEVSAYLFEKIDALLRTVPIRYLKWDMNRDLTLAGTATGHPAYRGQVLAVYALIDRIRQAHPEVEIESCASGGARIDYGILSHTHRVWTSDCNDALSRVAIQRGALQFIPPEIMGAHIGPAPAHTTGRSQSLDFRAAVALPGHLGIEMDVRTLDTPARESLKQWLTLYKRLRPILHQGQVWQGEAGDGVVWQAHGKHDGAEMVVLVYRLQPTQGRYTPNLRLPMLDRQARYQLQRIEPAVHEWSSSPLHQALLDGQSPVQAHGAWLAEAGLPLPRMQAESCLIIQIRRMESKT